MLGGNEPCFLFDATGSRDDSEIRGASFSALYSGYSSVYFVGIMVSI